jgi:hypothetical protein
MSVPMKTSQVCTTAGIRRLSTSGALIYKGKIFQDRRNLQRIREVGLVKLMNIQQGARYVEIMAANPAQERFARGWIRRA